MQDLNYQLKQLCHRHKESSYATRQARLKILQLAATQLHELGFKRMQAKSLKLKHTVALFKHWLETDISVGTIKNRMAHVRWWAEKVGKPTVTYKTNDEYYKTLGLTPKRRSSISPNNKAQTLTPQQLQSINDPYTRFSLQLQSLFGLRREEAIKFTPSYADKGDHITLKHTWTKGGKARSIPVNKPEQQQLLNEIKTFVGSGALISPNRDYQQQLNLYKMQTYRAGFKQLHGLRHAYAQERYYELTGWHCPKAGGLKRKQLNTDQKNQDQQARLTISKELGHERLQVLDYLGS